MVSAESSSSSTTPGSGIRIDRLVDQRFDILSSIVRTISTAASTVPSRCPAPVRGEEEPRRSGQAKLAIDHVEEAKERCLFSSRQLANF
jgi:hypothetical protein